MRLATDDGGDSSLRWSTRPRSVNAGNYHRTSIGPAARGRRDVARMQRSWVRGAIHCPIDRRPVDTIPAASRSTTPGPGDDRGQGSGEFS